MIASNSYHERTLFDFVKWRMIPMVTETNAWNRTVIPMNKDNTQAAGKTKDQIINGFVETHEAGRVPKNFLVKQILLKVSAFWQPVFTAVIKVWRAGATQGILAIIFNWNAFWHW